MKQLKNYQIQRLWRANEHEENLNSMPDQTHIIDGWDELEKFVGKNREMIVKWQKREGFPATRFYYRQKTDKSGRRREVWRRGTWWDKRKVGDWLQAKEWFP